MPGYAVAKLGAWLDRSAWFEFRDAADLALVLYWYLESAEIADRLYETDGGNEILLAEESDRTLASARLLGVEIAETIGADRLAELLTRWPGNVGSLVRALSVAGAVDWPDSEQRRLELIEALTRGLGD